MSLSRCRCERQPCQWQRRNAEVCSFGPLWCGVSRMGFRFQQERHGAHTAPGVKKRGRVVSREQGVKRNSARDAMRLLCARNFFHPRAASAAILRYIRYTLEAYGSCRIERWIPRQTTIQRVAAIQLAAAAPKRALPRMIRRKATVVIQASWKSKERRALWQAE